MVKVGSHKCDIKGIKFEGETMSKNIKKVLLKVEEGYIITYADCWGRNNSAVLGGWYRNNWKPEGWTIVDIFIHGTGVYVRSDQASKPRKLFDLIEGNHWVIKVANGLKPEKWEGFSIPVIHDITN